ncbi:MAG: hypothetical protein ACON5A_00290 [Candidatus Comchoanobacterales bacterium]
MFIVSVFSFLLIVTSAAVSASIAFEVLSIYFVAAPIWLISVAGGFYIIYNLLQSAGPLIEQMASGKKKWHEIKIEAFFYQCQKNNIVLTERHKRLIIKEFMSLDKSQEEKFLHRLRTYNQRASDPLKSQWASKIDEDDVNIEIFLENLNKALFVADFFRTVDQRSEEWWYLLFGFLNACFNGLTIVYLGVSRFGSIIPSLLPILYSETGLIILAASGLVSSICYTYQNASRLFKARDLFDQVSDRQSVMVSYGGREVFLGLCSLIMGFVSVIFNVRFALKMIGNGANLSIGALLSSVGASHLASTVTQALVFKRAAVLVCVVCVFVNIPSYMYRVLNHFVINRPIMKSKSASSYQEWFQWFIDQSAAITASFISLVIYYDSVYHVITLTGVNTIVATLLSFSVSLLILPVIFAGFCGLLKPFELMTSKVNIDYTSISSPELKAFDKRHQRGYPETPFRRDGPHHNLNGVQY